MKKLCINILLIVAVFAFMLLLCGFEGKGMSCQVSDEDEVNQYTLTAKPGDNYSVQETGSGTEEDPFTFNITVPANESVTVPFELVWTTQRTDLEQESHVESFSLPDGLTFTDQNCSIGTDGNVSDGALLYIPPMIIGGKCEFAFSFATSNPLDENQENAQLTALSVEPEDGQNDDSGSLRFWQTNVFTVIITAVGEGSDPGNDDPGNDDPNNDDPNNDNPNNEDTDNEETTSFEYYGLISRNQQKPADEDANPNTGGSTFPWEAVLLVTAVGTVAAVCLRKRNCRR